MRHLEQKELDKADRIAAAGHDVVFLPRQLDARTPDITIDGVPWEMKASEGASAGGIVLIRYSRGHAEQVVVDLARSETAAIAAMRDTMTCRKRGCSDATLQHADQQRRSGRMNVDYVQADGPASEAELLDVLQELYPDAALDTGRSGFPQVLLPDGTVALRAQFDPTEDWPAIIGVASTRPMAQRRTAARELFDGLAARTRWKLNLSSDDSAVESLASRPALAHPA